MAPESNRPTRVSIRDIAKAVGVSIMTVSLSLRNNPKISEQTRNRIRLAAEKMGYKPDPEIARLMTRLHHSRYADDAPPMAIVDLSLQSQTGKTSNLYGDRVRQGARKRAEALGYLVTQFNLVDYAGDVKRLLKVINYRGIKGILLIPPAQPIELPAEIDWSPFSVIAATYAITPLHFHRVVPHQFIDMCRLIKLLESLGKRAIGAVFEKNFEERIHHHFTAAIKLHNYGDNILRLPSTKPLDAQVLRTWLIEHKPDALVCHFAPELKRTLEEALPQGVERPLLVSLGSVDDPDISYWDERPEDIGADAASLLAGMIQHNEAGLPDSPRTSMIHGTFHPSAEVTAQTRTLARVSA